jgi:hypothetical protein
MREIATISFHDAQTGDQTIAIVRKHDDCIGLCLSLEKDADLEVFLQEADCRKIVDALNKAMRGMNTEEN